MLPTSADNATATATATAAPGVPGATGPWWGEVAMPLDHAVHCAIGPLHLWIRRRRHEWRIVHRQGDEEAEQGFQLDPPTADVELPEDLEVHRFAAHAPGEAVVLQPLLADLPVVTRPKMPFSLLPGDEVSLYVAVPLWLRVTTAETPPRTMFEVPTVRLSETWFGATTLTGELCYASRTRARLHIENIPDVPFRAITEVRLANRAASELALDRLKLPTPNLALWADGRGALWTQSVSVERRENGTVAEVRMVPGAPRQLTEGAREVAPPRVRTSGNVLVRTLDALMR